MAEQQPGEARAERSPRVLVIDDEPHVVAAVQRQLSQLDCRLSISTDSVQSWELLSRSEPYAVVISDNRMPGMTGEELLTRMRNAGLPTRRILLTATTDAQDAIQAFNHGLIHRFFNKPWDSKELVAAVNEELVHYEELRRQQEQLQRELVAEQQSIRLKLTERELKQVQTQLFLHQEGLEHARGQAPGWLRQCVVLVVEDHDMVRDLLVSTLRIAGIHNCLGMPSGTEAMRFLEESPAVDIVISEYDMADTSGLALFQTLRSSQSPSAQAGFVLVSTLENREAVERAIRAGVNGYLLKPFHLQSLFNQARGVLKPIAGDPLPDGARERLRSLRYLIAHAQFGGTLHIQNLLESVGARDFVTANAGRKVLAELPKGDRDVLIFDSSLTDPPPWELYREIYKRSARARLPALVVTANAPDRAIYESLAEVGFAGFLPGQLQGKTLFRGILQALERQKPESATANPH